ncbi:ENP1 [Candida oxycetoniae]|uniref:ENP1 n=1 Tax=Candida oxycetoniae TaxID=497107 RepID=A0AAI9T1A2_9ASCO|nr:ENP1 [Candida oxycetoniae]KAI3406572.1 ENP1 [Candida oxycetoniae]
MGKVAQRKTERHNPLKPTGSDVKIVNIQKLQHLLAEDEEEEELNLNQKKDRPFQQGEGDDEEEDEDEEEEEEEEEEDEEEEEYEEIEIDEAEYEQEYGQQESRNLGELIMQKLNSKLQQKEIEEKEAEPAPVPEKVLLAYRKLAVILSTYKSGKLPKIFSILPSLNNWEQVLFITCPWDWTPHATYEATKLFVSNLQANEAQKFIQLVLLEKFRTSIEESEDHSLNYHLYRALKKSLYKPGAFFKGFLLPLVDGHCTVREATIAASVLAKVSVPVLHSSVALSQLLQRDYSPATTVFIRVLIEKKYALPYQALDDLVFYFMRFRNDNEEKEPMPVVWHKAFLAFAQRYKNDITDDQRDFLLETVRQRFHHAIGPEIRRELLAGKPRLTSGDNTKMVI